MTSDLFNQAMLLMAKDPKTIFIGQSVRYDCCPMFKSLDGVPDCQRIEFPVAEELQTGAAIGLSLQGFLPVSIYPRIDFMLRADDQIVNHLDKLAVMTRQQFRPKVILRTKVGKSVPLDAGPQHTQNHTMAYQWMCRHIWVVEIVHPDQIMPVYQAAYERDGSSLIVECI